MTVLPAEAGRRSVIVCSAMAVIFASVSGRPESLPALVGGRGHRSGPPAWVSDGRPRRRFAERSPGRCCRKPPVRRARPTPRPPRSSHAFPTCARRSNGSVLRAARRRRRAPFADAASNIATAPDVNSCSGGPAVRDPGHADLLQGARLDPMHIREVAQGEPDPIVVAQGGPTQAVVWPMCNWPTGWRARRDRQPASRSDSGSPGSADP